MSLERIRDHILQQAKDEAERLLKEAKERIEVKLLKARTSLKKELEERLTTLDQELQEENARALSALKAQNQLKLLELKNQLINRLFEQVLGHLLALSTENYLALLEGWLNKLDLKEKANLRLSPDDTRRIGEELVKRVNFSKKKEFLSLDPGPAAIKGGFIIRTKTFEIDHSLETFLGYLKEELSPEIAKGLFI